MKKEKVTIPESKEKKTEPGSDPVNKFKKGQHTSVAALDNIITGAVENVKARSGKGFDHIGTVPVYGDES